MKKQIFMTIFISVAVSIITVVGIAVFLFRTEIWNAEYDIHILGAIPLLAAVFILAAVIANSTTDLLTKRIIRSIEEMSMEESSFTNYHELIPYVAAIKAQKEEMYAKIEELTRRSDTIETITDNMQEGLILVDETGRILSANSSAGEVFGERMEQKSIQHICREPEFQKAITKCLNGENMEIQMRREKRIYTVFFSPVCSDGQKEINGAVVLFHDVTDQQRAETQRREFSANVSHELKTPLTTISALSEMIAQGMAKSEDIEFFAKRITEQSGRLLVLIDDIIRLSEFDEGASERELSVFNLRELAESVIASLKDSAGSVQIELVGEDFEISANYRMIDELLYNLIDNGIKYNKKDGKVTVSITKAEAGQFKISVSDTGIGISKEHQSRVFERFYRADKSRSKKTGGTGLGLSIVKHIVEHHNGRITLKSAEGTGTTIVCYCSPD